MRKLLIVLIVAAGLTGVGAVAYASIPGSDGVVHGCRKNSDGSVRVIDSDAGQTCVNGWTVLNWNQAGPQGPAGVNGTDGADGVSGYELVTNAVTVVDGPQGPDAALVARCPAGKRALGGGGGAVSDDGARGERNDVLLQSSNPADWDGDGIWEGWRVQTRNLGDTTVGYTIRAWAICANVAP